MVKKFSLSLAFIICFFCVSWVNAQETITKTQQETVVVTQSTVQEPAQVTPVVDQAQNQVKTEAQAQEQLVQPAPEAKAVKVNEEVVYTLGPDDIIEITIQRHSEFSGVFPVNLEGKVQYNYVGDIVVTGLTKKELEAKIKQLISTYAVNPEVNVTILEYRSKVYYVLGEVGRPGKYYMRSETIPVREAIVEAGLPTIASATRKCRLITPDKKGNPKTKYVNLYSLLYGGNLKQNIDMHPGDVLYVPSTIMAKVTRIINPVTEPLTAAASGAAAATTGTGAVTAIRTPTRPTQ
ncbi:MAG: polysaccharide biosynthesis/export family protein [Candidatus Omnitrophota bacterium]